MNDIADSPVSNRRREYPAWFYLLLGAVFVIGCAVLVVTGVTDGWRRPWVPYFGIAVGFLGIAHGAREWRRNGSATARRVKSAQERREDEKSRKRVLRWQAMRLGLVVVVAVVVAVVLLVQG